MNICFVNTYEEVIDKIKGKKRTFEWFSVSVFLKKIV
jgi:hypothetical protein